MPSSRTTFRWYDEAGALVAETPSSVPPAGAASVAHRYVVDETAEVTEEDRRHLWDSARFAHAGRLGGPAVDQPFRRTILAGGRRGGRTTAAAAAAVPALHQLFREAARQEEEFVAYRRRAIALGIDPELADQAYEEAIAASQESPRPFCIADAEARLRRLVGPADVPPDFVSRLGRATVWDYEPSEELRPGFHVTEEGEEPAARAWLQEAMPSPPQILRADRTHHDSYTMDGVQQQIVEDAYRAYAAHLERRERALRAAYGIPDGATTAEAIRIIRQHGRRGGSLHAPERAMDIPGPSDENGNRTVVHFTVPMAVPMLTPEEARAAAQRYLDGEIAGTWVQGEHHRRESHFDAIDRLTAPAVDDGYRYGSDQSAFDTKPDHCWRCCAVKAQNDLGTCDPCREDLRS